MDNGNQQLALGMYNGNFWNGPYARLRAIRRLDVIERVRRWLRRVRENLRRAFLESTRTIRTRDTRVYHPTGPNSLNTRRMQNSLYN